LTELFAGIVVAAIALVLVLEPLVRGRSGASAILGGPNDVDDLDFSDVEESESPKVQALLALREIEFDRETGKLSDRDYKNLKATYSQAALQAIDAEDGLEEGDSGGQAAAVCPACGPRPESSAKYCSDCGSLVQRPDVSSRCGACGAELPPEAKFCSECGAKL